MAVTETSTADLRQLILTNELGNQMLDMVAPIYDKSRVALYIFQAFGIVLSKEVDFFQNDFINQIFIQTATWGLKYWEQEYEVVPDPSWDIEQRRQNLLSILKYKAPITPKKIEDRITAMLGLETTVREHVADNTIEIFIRGFVADYSEVEKLLDKILPAHLRFTINTSDVIDSKLTGYNGIIVSQSETFNVTVR